uniref:Uncharacterized protein n=1 Tax=Anguilla anguilla TaxID=7936 RepID=A0A0E9PJH0_ANGAN
MAPPEARGRLCCLACAPTAAALHLHTDEINQLPTAHRAGASQDGERGEDHNLKSVRTHAHAHTPISHNRTGSNAYIKYFKLLSTIFS